MHRSSIDESIFPPPLFLAFAFFLAFYFLHTSYLRSFKHTWTSRLCLPAPPPPCLSAPPLPCLSALRSKLHSQWAALLADSDHRRQDYHEFQAKLRMDLSQLKLDLQTTVTSLDTQDGEYHVQRSRRQERAHSHCSGPGGSP